MVPSLYDGALITQVCNYGNGGLVTMLSAIDRTAPSPAQPHTGGVTLINSFEVPAGREAAFVARWHAMAAWFRTQPGYVSNRLHQAVSPNAAYHFVNVVQWRSEAE